MNKLKRILRAVPLVALALAFAVQTDVQAADWDEQPTVKKSVAPKNPDKKTGMVMATITIDEKGFVVDAVIKKATDAALEGPVMDAVKQWRFNPAKLGGKPISCTINVPFKFAG